MRERAFIATVLLAGISAAACSKPAPSTPAQSDTRASAAPANLAGSTVAGVPVVSGLEAGHDPRLALPGPMARKSVQSVVASRTGTKVEPLPSAVMGSEPHAAMRMTATSVAALTPGLAPEALPLAAIAGPDRAPRHDPYLDAGLGSRGPAIIIRGGMGGPDDDCDLLHMRGRHGFGAAVNRLTPPMGARGGFGGSTRFR